MNSCLLNGYRCSSKDILIEQRTQKKKILQRYADPLYLIPSNPCNAISKCSSIGTRILISLTWRTRCIRNAPCRCIAYAVSFFLLSHPVSTLFFSRSAILQQKLVQTRRNQNFVNKVYPFDHLSVNSRVSERYSRFDERRKSVGYSRYDAPFGSGGIVMRTVTV